MSRKYKFYDKEGLYFVSFATVFWVSVFVREDYFRIVVESLDFCRKKKGLEIFCWCIMPNHVHIIMRAKEGSPETVLGRFKEFTSKQLQKAIASNVQESRKDWLLEKFLLAGRQSSNVTNGQFWQHHNKPIQLWSPHVIDQKVEYIHRNPVVAGFVEDPHYWNIAALLIMQEERVFWKLI